MTFIKGHPRYNDYGFPKGNIPWNKGLRGVCKPNSSSFKKGDNKWLGRTHKKDSKILMGRAKWKGGKTKRYGYVLYYQPDHPSSVNGYVREHRLIMERHIGRYLERQEVVHHINEVKDDNHIENLLLLPNEAEHRRLHNELRRDRKATGRRFKNI